MKTPLLLITLLMASLAMPASAENIRTELPTVISIGGLWPKGINLSAQYQLLPRLAVGAELGFALISINTGLYGRWYFDDAPGSWYAEGLAVQHFALGGAGGYSPGSFFSLNGLIGWEHRSREGINLHTGFGLGVSPNMIPDGIMGLINIDFGVGYAF